MYKFVDENKDEFGVRWLCRKFDISTRCYYNYKADKKQEYRKIKDEIKRAIQDIYYECGRLIGHRGMTEMLKRKGIRISKTTCHKYMNKELNLHSIIVRKKPRYVKGERNKVFANLLEREFEVNEKNKIWCTDFTYIRLANNKMRYNCSIIDLYDRSVVATLDSDYINTDLAIDTLKRALEAEKPAKGLILHSDQGVQFTSWAFVGFCKEYGIRQSMSKAGCPYDNAPMERFYRTLKTELIYQYSFENEKALDDAISRYVYLWYNQIRPHSYNNYKSPYEVRLNGKKVDKV